MTESEMRAAALRQIDAVRKFMGDPANYPPMATELWNLLHAVAASLPFDDGEPATPDFVRAVLPANSPFGVRCSYLGKFGTLSWQLWNNGHLFAVWVNERTVTLAGMTRGEFRALCVGLGVPLAEATP